jgi:hypothetical protein
MSEIEVKWLIIKLLYLYYFYFYYHFSFDCVLKKRNNHGYMNYGITK